MDGKALRRFQLGQRSEGAAGACLAAINIRVSVMAPPRQTCRASVVWDIYDYTKFCSSGTSWVYTLISIQSYRPSTT